MSRAGRDGHYKWTVLVNTTIGTLMATIDSSIVLISMPAIFRGIHLNPLTTSNTSYLLWLLMGYMVVTAVLVVSFGINSVAGIAGSFIGLVAGGLLAAVDWHLIFYISVPIGVAGTLWAYLKLKEVAKGEGGRLDLPGNILPGNILFGAGLVAVLVGITYALQPYGGSTMGWGNPLVLALIIGGVAMLGAFVAVELRTAQPMLDPRLFRIRAFAAGNIASLLSSIGRGGLMFMLVIWLQGIWLPLHGYSFEDTPLWAGIYMLPLTGGFLIAGPASGFLSDRFGARPFATGGMIAAALTFGLLMLLPVDFGYPWFALLLLGNGLAMGLFSSPNTASVMNAVPANRRGVASGMSATFRNAGMTLSIGLFFSIMVAGLSASLSASLSHGLIAAGLPPGSAARVAGLPPVSVLFAAFLGYNPMRSLLGPALNALPPARQATITGHAFFPSLISAPFHHGLSIVFTFALVMCLVAAAASWLRGGQGARAETGETALPGPDAAVALTGDPAVILKEGA